MMIIKKGMNRFHVLDVLGAMGVWELDMDGLERYLGALEKKRTSSLSKVKTFPLLENADSSSEPRASAAQEGNGSLDGEDVFSLGLPDACFFDTRIVRANARSISTGIITPPSISIDVNTLCNYACRWCCADVHKDERNKTLDLQDLEERIIRPLAEGGNLTWYLVGGEPALTPERTASIAKMIVKHTSANSPHAPFIALDSNGTAFARNAELFIESGVNTVQFSLSSTNTETDRRLRGCPQGVDPVKTIIGAIQSAKSLGLHCGINMVLWKEDSGWQNLNDVEDVIGLGRQLEVDFIRITPAVYTGVSTDHGMRLEREDLRQVAQSLYRLAPLFKGNGATKIVSMLLANENSMDLETDRPMICRGGTCFVHVDHKGDIFPCAMVMPDFRIGNILSDDLMQLWFNPDPLSAWREVVDVCPECAACRDRNYCVGKCPAYAWFKFGDISLSTKPVACPCAEIT